jgi:hypothetical protein
MYQKRFGATVVDRTRAGVCIISCYYSGQTRRIRPSGIPSSRSLRQKVAHTTPVPGTDFIIFTSYYVGGEFVMP